MELLLNSTTNTFGNTFIISQRLSPELLGINPEIFSRATPETFSRMYVCVDSAINSSLIFSEIISEILFKKDFYVIMVIFKGVPQRT